MTTAAAFFVSTGVEISTSCTACGMCLVTCPTGALVPAPERPRVFNDSCTGCLACIEICPTGAISEITRTGTGTVRP